MLCTENYRTKPSTRLVFCDFVNLKKTSSLPSYHEPIRKPGQIHILQHRLEEINLCEPETTVNCHGLKLVVAEYEYEVGQNSSWLQLLGGTSESNHHNRRLEHSIQINVLVQ